MSKEINKGLFKPVSDAERSRFLKARGDAPTFVPAAVAGKWQGSGFPAGKRPDEDRVRDEKMPNPENTKSTPLNSGDYEGQGVTVRNCARRAVLKTAAMLRGCLENPETDVSERAREAVEQVMSDVRALCGYDEDEALEGDAALDEMFSALTDARDLDDDDETKRAHVMRICQLGHKWLDDNAGYGDEGEGDADENFKQVMKEYSEKVHSADLEAGATKISRNERRPGTQHLGAMPSRK